MSSFGFSPEPSKYAKTKEDIRLDINYETLEKVRKNKNGKTIWLQQNEYKEEYWDGPSIDLTLEEAKWLISELKHLVELIEEEKLQKPH